MSAADKEKQEQARKAEEDRKSLAIAQQLQEAAKQRLSTNKIESSVANEDDSSSQNSSELDDLNGDEADAQTRKWRANHLPPPEIVFDHLSRIDSVKSQIAPVALEAMSELNS